jgi:hypothetical protein
VNDRTAPEPRRAQPSDIVIESAASPVEIAAITAVLTAALREQAADAMVAPAQRSVWESTARGLRKPLERGMWRGFTP